MLSLNKIGFGSAKKIKQAYLFALTFCYLCCIQKYYN